MTKPAITVFVFGLYMLGQGLILLIMPNVLLRLVGLAPAIEIWVRVVGIAVLVLSYYYIRNALLNNTVFFRLSVEGRTLQLALFAGLVALAGAPVILLAFAGFEFLAGLWTLHALRKS
ncbi:MAG: hypothetical protein J0L53_16535 [Spirochaetes bacterium]|nr:hypothetical protein [Spirochaetota bacterium]